MYNLDLYLGTGFKCTRKGGRSEPCCLVTMACLADCFGVERSMRVRSLAALLRGTFSRQSAGAPGADAGGAKADSRCCMDGQAASQREEARLEPAPQADYACRPDSEVAAAQPLRSVPSGSGPPASTCLPRLARLPRSRRDNLPGPTMRAAGGGLLGKPEGAPGRPGGRERPLTQADRLRLHETSRLAMHPRPRGSGRVPPSPLRSGFARCCDLGGTPRLPVEYDAASAARVALFSSAMCSCRLVSRGC